MDTHQTWIREPASGAWRFDVFREPSDGDTWICRREPAIRMPYGWLIEWTDDGIPYGRPEVVLLFKAKHAHQEKNGAEVVSCPLPFGLRHSFGHSSFVLRHLNDLLPIRVHSWLKQ